MEQQRILFVNASQDELVKFENSVRGIGYVVDYAPNGYEALRFLESNTYRILVTTYQVSGIDCGTLLMKAKAYNHELVTLIITVNFNKADISFFFGKQIVDGVVFYPVDYHNDVIPLLNEFVAARILSKIDIEDSIKKNEEKQHRKEMLKSVLSLLKSLDGKWMDTKRLASALFSLDFSDEECPDEKYSLLLSFENEVIDIARQVYDSTDIISLSRTIDLINKRIGNSNFSIRAEDAITNSVDGNYFDVAFLIIFLTEKIQQIYGTEVAITCDVSVTGDRNLEIYFKANIPTELFYSKADNEEIQIKQELIDVLMTDYTLKCQSQKSERYEYHFLVAGK